MGRYGHWSAKTAGAKRTFVLVYGQHATIERLMPIIDSLRVFGDVYLPDNPGFGGMEPAYKIKRYPDLPFYAEHLNHFIDNYVAPDRQLTLFGISYGFQMLTQLLHDYPDLSTRVENLISFVGFASHHDFHMAKRISIPLMYMLTNSGRTRLGAAMYDRILNERLIVAVYSLTKPIQAKFKTLPKDEARRYAKEQAWLWLVNDNRTHGVTAWDFFKRNDLTGYRLDVDTLHVGVPNDHLINNKRIVHELADMFTRFTAYELNLDNHAPLDVDTPEKVMELMPTKLQTTLSQSANKKAVTK